MRPGPGIPPDIRGFAPARECPHPARRRRRSAPPPAADPSPRHPRSHESLTLFPSPALRFLMAPSLDDSCRRLPRLQREDLDAGAGFLERGALIRVEGVDGVIPAFHVDLRPNGTNNVGDARRI